MSLDTLLILAALAVIILLLALLLLRRPPADPTLALLQAAQERQLSLIHISEPTRPY